VLWCLALLSIVVIGVLHTTQMDLQVGKNYGDRIQAHYLALAGIEKAKALLYQNARDRARGGRSFSGEFYDTPDEFRNVSLGRGQFQVFRRGRDDEGGGIIYGVSDEESRLNLNTASTEALGRISGMTTNIVAAIADWRDSDNTVSPNGAEVDYYAGYQPPYRPRNGPFQSVRELLMVRDVSREQLFGRDSHQNGMLDTLDENGREVFLNDRVETADLGWAALLTIDSSVKNSSATGQDRVNVQSADEGTLMGVNGITSEIARSIVAYRRQNQFQSIADLLDVTAAQNNSQGTNSANSTQPSGNSSTGSSGRRVINEDLLLDIADEITTDDNGSKAGAININTASVDVLVCLPGVDRQLAQSIISYRYSNGYFANTAWLLKVPGMTRDIFKQVAPLASARSETYRILSEGKVNSSGARQRIQMVVHIGLDEVSALAYREDDL
jgi:competence ComEA-like helix-hairpin-helix protein